MRSAHKNKIYLKKSEGLCWLHEFVLFFTEYAPEQSEGRKFWRKNETSTYNTHSSPIPYFHFLLHYFSIFSSLCNIVPRCAVIFEAIITQEDHCCCQLFPINIAPKMFLLCTSFFVYFGKVYCRFLISPPITICFWNGQCM